MKRKLLALLLIGCMALVIGGCDGNGGTNSNGETKNPLDDFLNLDPVITDKVIMGQAVNSIGSLYDVTEVLAVENYEIADCHPYSENKVIVLYVGAKDSFVRICDITNGKTVKEIKMENIIIVKDADLVVVNNDFAYIKELSGRVLIYLNLKVNEYSQIVMEEEPVSFLMPGEGDVFYFTLKNDCNIYQYIAETGNSFSVFDAENMVKSIDLEYVVQGGNTLIVYVESEGYTGYAMLSLEMQDLSPLEIIEGKFYYNGNEYVYSALEESPVLYIYDPMTPRLAVEFKLDYAQEVRDVRLCKYSACFLTIREDNNDLYIRYYSLSDGVLKNEIVLTNANITNIYDFENSNMVLVNTDEKVYIWNTEIIEKVLE